MINASDTRPPDQDTNDSNKHRKLDVLIAMFHSREY